MTNFGPYELLRKLGTGATAEVYLAAGRVGDETQLLALKILLPHLAEDELVRLAFLKEARTTVVLRNRNVVQVLDVGEADGRPFMAMEYVRGWAVSVVLKKLKEQDERLSIAEACAIVRDAALGLHYAHEAIGVNGKPMGLIHRDVSPQNLIVREDARVKVVDFGLAKVGATAATQTGGLKGKPAYMAPEQITGGKLDRRADVYAAGAVLWELLTGKRLRPGHSDQELLQQAISPNRPNLRQPLPDAPDGLVLVVDAALEKDPQRRTATAQELAEGLRPFIRTDTPQRLATRLSSLFGTLPKDIDEARAQAKKAPPNGRHRPASPVPPAVQTTDKVRWPEELEREFEPMRAVTKMDTVVAPPPDRSPRRNRVTEPEPTDSMESSEVRRTDKVPPPPANDDAWMDENPALRALMTRKFPSRSRRLLLSGLSLGLAVVLAVLGLASARFLPRSSRPEPETSQAEEATDEPATDEGATPRRHEGGPSQARGAREAGAKGKLMLTSNVPAFVREGTTELGMTPLTTQLPAGRHKLEVRTPDGVQTRKLDITVLAGQETTKHVILK